MIPLTIGTIILALTYGVFWHEKPAKARNDHKQTEEFRLGRRLNSILCWLLVMPPVVSPVRADIASETPAVSAGRLPLVRPARRALTERKWFPRILQDLPVFRPSRAGKAI